jgi:hypothetical protein
MANYIIVHSVKVATDFVPETFGRLTTIGPRFILLRHGQDRSFQVCQCECGNTLVVETSSLVSQNTKSCGCLRRDVTIARATKHRKRHLPEYRTWQNMIQRCTNQNRNGYADYGGRGIRVCGRWLDPENGFLNFLEDMGLRPTEKHSIDRIDVDGNYEPSNCRWTTDWEQSRNTRRNHNWTIDGRTQCKADWAAEKGIDKGTLEDRLRRGWSSERALNTPVNTAFRKK